MLKHLTVSSKVVRGMDWKFKDPEGIGEVLAAGDIQNGKFVVHYNFTFISVKRKCVIAIMVLFFPNKLKKIYIYSNVLDVSHVRTS